MNLSSNSAQSEPRLFSEDFLKSLHKHIINIMCFDSGPAALKEHSGEYAIYNFSGFIVEIDDRWFVITAGHIFEELKEVRAQGAILSNWQIDDSIVSKNPMPPYRIALDIDNDVTSIYENGIDCAFFELDFLTRQAISNQGICGIPRNIWEAEDIEDFSLWLLIGTPNELAKLATAIPFQKSHATVQLERRYQIPDGFTRTEFSRIYAAIRFESVIDYEQGFNIEGMSGGPIFGLKPSTNSILDDYRLIGIQSKWNEKDTVAICPAPPILKALSCNIKDANVSSK